MMQILGRPDRSVPVAPGRVLPTQHIVPLFIDNFCDSYAGWTTPAGFDAFTKAVDAVNYLSRDNDVAQGMQCTVANDKASGAIRRTLAVAQDWSGNTRISLRFYVHAADYEYVNRMRLEVLDSTNAKYRYYTFYESSDDATQVVGPGWHERTFHIDDYRAIDGANFDMTDVKYLRITIYHPTVEKTPSITFDRLMVYNPLTTPSSALSLPLVILGFDDGSAQHYDVAAALSGRGMVGTFYVYGSGIGGAGALTLAQLKLMRFAGHLIGSHTYSHQQPFNGLSAAQQINEVRQNVLWLQKNGLGDGAYHLAMPGNVAWQQQFDERFGAWFHTMRGGHPNATLSTDGYPMRNFMQDGGRAEDRRQGVGESPEEA